MEFRSSMGGPHVTEVSARCARQYKGIELSAEEFDTMLRDTVSFRQESSVWHLMSLTQLCLLQAPVNVQANDTRLAAGCA